MSRSNQRCPAPDAPLFVGLDGRPLAAHGIQQIVPSGRRSRRRIPAASEAYLPDHNILWSGEQVARPEGAGRALATYRVPVEGRDEWIAAAARHLA
jgi:hypothetical protein